MNRSAKRAGRLLAGLVTLALAGGPAAARQEPVTAFVDVSVLPMDSDRVLSGQTVVVRGERIVAMGPAGSITVPAGATRIEGRGRFLMPGLAEMHAHIPGGNAPPQLIEDIMFLYIANGITTIRGMLGAPTQFEWRDRAARGDIVAPTMYLAGPSLNQNTVSDAPSAARLVEANHATGYDLQKVHPFPGAAAYDSAAAAARRLGFTMAGHVPTDAGLERALAAKQDIDHLDGYLEAALPPAVHARLVHPTDVIAYGEVLRSIDMSRIPALVDATVRAGIYNSPTEYLWENLWGEVNVDSIMALPEMRYATPQWRQGWRNQKAQRLGFDQQQGITAADRQKLTDFRRTLLKALADADAPLLMGTDSPQMFNVPGYALHHELRLARTAGLTPYQVLKSGTATVGRYVREVLKKSDDFGTVAEGKRADLVLLEGNPLENLDALTRRVGVMVRGRWYDADHLRQGLAEIEARNAG
jgi:hypothetical protein